MARTRLRHFAHLDPLPDAKRGGRPSEILIIGLGRFGMGLATTLMELGHEVLGIDSSARVVQQCSGDLTRVVEADSTDTEALRQLGAAEFRHGVVAIGNDREASILTVAALDDLGLRDIWAKALSEPHARILERVGAHHVVFPEWEMGERVAHLITGQVLDFIEVDEGFALVEVRAPVVMIGKSLANSEVRQRYGITVVCIKPKGGSFTYATPDTVVAEGDLLLVAGETHRAERFADQR